MCSTAFVTMKAISFASPCIDDLEKLTTKHTAYEFDESLCFNLIGDSAFWRRQLHRKRETTAFVRFRRVFLLKYPLPKQGNESSPEGFCMLLFHSSFIPHLVNNHAKAQIADTPY